MLKSLGVLVIAFSLVSFNRDIKAHEAKQSQEHQKPSAPVTPVPEKQKDDTSNLQSNGEPYVNAKVWVVKTPEKDGYDRASFLMNEVLAVAAMIGLIYGVWNLSFLSSQVKEMKQQRIAMQDTLTVIKCQAEIMDAQARDAASSSSETLAALKRQGDWMCQSAKAQRLSARAAILGAEAASNQIQMMKSKAQARLVAHIPSDEPRVGFPVEDVSTEGITQELLDVRIEVSNEGETGAFKVSATGNFLVAPLNIGKASALAGTKFSVPAILRAGSKMIVRIEPAESGLALIPSVDWKAIRDGGPALHIFGVIAYEDIFGEGHSTPFHFAWKVIRYGDDTGEVEPKWENLSPTRHGIARG
jgi:hypothetical protein